MLSIGPRTGPRAIWSCMLSLASAIALFGVRVASAQCYLFSADNSPSLSVSITNLPHPNTTTTNGNTGYLYDLSGLSGNTATLTVNGASSTISAFPEAGGTGFTIFVLSGPTSSDLEINIIESGFGASVVLTAAGYSNQPNGLFPSGLPAVLPPFSTWSSPSLSVQALVAGVSTSFFTYITAAGSCSSIAPLQVTTTRLSFC